MIARLSASLLLIWPSRLAATRNKLTAAGHNSGFLVIRGVGYACAAPVQGGGNVGVVFEVGDSPCTRGSSRTLV
jgi:hypothetical protein